VGILKDDRIQPGEKVLTAGGDQIFPRGLPVGVAEKVVTDPDRDGFIDVIVTPAAHLNRLDEVLVITSTEPRFPAEQQQDMATSEMLKGGQAAAIAEAIKEQKKASEVMAERLPGLTDPNAPPQTPAAGTAPGSAQPGQSATPAAAVPPPAPKLLHAQHPDRFTVGTGLPQSAQTSAPGDQDKKPAPKAGLKPEPKAGLKPASKPEAKTGQKTNPPPAHAEGKTQP
jgi:rod shape-determining protein MreC